MRADSRIARIATYRVKMLAKLDTKKGRAEAPCRGCNSARKLSCVVRRGLARVLMQLKYELKSLPAFVPMSVPLSRLEPTTTSAGPRSAPRLTCKSQRRVSFTNTKIEQCSGWKHKKNTAGRASRRGQLAGTRYARQANRGTGLGTRVGATLRPAVLDC